MENDLTVESKARIAAMGREELCRKWRSAPLGDPFWQGEAGKYAQDRLFRVLGGFTPEISKKIGWEGWHKL